MIKRFKPGDTIVEVTMAIVIFSAVVVAALALMNRGVSSAQTSLEITLAREAMNSQAEALRFIQGKALTATDDAGTQQWVDLVNNYVTKSSPSKLSSCQIPEKAFVINTRDANLTVVDKSDPRFYSGSAPYTGEAPVYPRILYGSGQDTNDVDALDNSTINKIEGIWIEAVQVNVDATGARAFDFHIRACWGSTGQSTPNTLGTIVRLYNPSRIKVSLQAPLATPNDSNNNAWSGNAANVVLQDINCYYNTYGDYPSFNNGQPLRDQYINLMAGKCKSTLTYDSSITAGFISVLNTAGKQIAQRGDRVVAGDASTSLGYYYPASSCVGTVYKSNANGDDIALTVSELPVSTNTTALVYKLREDGGVNIHCRQLTMGN
ncbi:hypothetical protein FWF48_01895 [Candidatus Saccharibacteria bacterium]|nr:hypothetical protein [Candidatus Saccharibacteria bacterium]